MNRNAGTALRETEQTLRRLIDGVQDYAIYMLDPTGLIVSWNTGAARIMRYSLEEALGESVSRFYTDEDCRAGVLEKALETAARDGKYEGEGWRVCKDGTCIWVNVVIEAIFDEAGKLVGFAKITRDMTERREAQLALEQARDQLAHAQKMESIGQLTGGVAHDFNNLLTVVIGNLETLRRQLESSEPNVVRMRRHVEHALRGARRGTSLIQRLLAFSRRQPLDPKPVSVEDLISGMSELLRSTLGEQITVHTAVADGLWRVHIDPNQLENAILNLAVNARDAMPSGGELAISAQNTEVHESWRGVEEELLPGEYVTITIGDTGIGIGPDVISHVFEPFFTTKEIGQGTGLGLSQVYGFIKQSGGHVGIESELGRGTTVTIYLPRGAPEQIMVEASDEPVPLGDAARGATVLLVEDNDDVRAYSHEILSEFGFGVLEAVRGQDALEVLARHPEIALLFTDIGLPGGMNGWGLAIEARRMRPDLKVLLTTAYASEVIAAEERRDSSMHLLAKPFTSADLANKLEAILDRPSGRPIILVVEDEPLVRMVAVDELAALGFQVEEAATATEAVNAMRRGGGSFDAAVIDVGLPDRKGDELLGELREISPALPVVIASGYCSVSLRDSFKDDRLVCVIDKPYSGEQLEAALQAIGVACPGGAQ